MKEEGISLICAEQPKGEAIEEAEAIEVEKDSSIDNKDGPVRHQNIEYEPWHYVKWWALA